MTHTTAAGTFPALGDSILGPILMGFTTTPRDAQLIDEVWHTAADSVPATSPVLKVQAGRSSQPLTHQRRVLTGQGTAYLKLAKLCDVRGQEPNGESWKRWRWMVAAKIAGDDASRQLAGNGRTPIRIDVTSYQIRAGTVLGAQQLGLFRHFVVAGFRALDPSLVVIGGQNSWHDGWWQVAPKAGQ